MNPEVVASSIAQANAAFGLFERAGKLAADSLIDQVNYAREIGLHLKELKKEAGHGNFGKLFETDHGKPNEAPAFHFSAEWGRTFIRVADRLKDGPITELQAAWASLKDVMVAIGALPQSSRGAQTPSGEFGVHATAQKTFMGFVSMLGKEIEKSPIEEWPHQILENWNLEFEKFDPIRDRIRLALAA